MHQTKRVVSGAMTVSATMERASRRLGSTSTEAKSAALENLHDTSQRLIALATLAEQRIDLYGCPPDLLDDIHSLSEQVKRAARRLLDAEVADLFSVGIKILALRNTIPYGIGASMTGRIERICHLLRSCGGLNGMDREGRVNLEQAVRISNEVVAAEAETISLNNFEIKEFAKCDRRRIGSVGDARDQALLAATQDGARRIAEAFTHALAAGAIRHADLFSHRHTLVPRTEPPQHLTPYTAFADQILPSILDSFLGVDARVRFAIAVSQYGYVPTHQLEVSRPQRPGDVEWNLAHCRNHRLRDDPTLIASAQNQTPILLQTYLRDLGEICVLMREAAAPITVGGAHWGAFVLGYDLV